MFRFCTWAACGRLNFGCACPFFLHSLFLPSASGKTWAPSWGAAGGVSPHGGCWGTSMPSRMEKLPSIFKKQLRSTISPQREQGLKSQKEAEIYIELEEQLGEQLVAEGWEQLLLSLVIRASTLVSKPEKLVPRKPRHLNTYYSRSQVFSWFLMDPLIFWDGGGST